MPADQSALEQMAGFNFAQITGDELNRASISNLPTPSLPTPA